MICSSCNETSRKLVEYFGKIEPYDNPKERDRSRSSHLCGKCLVGCFVPVFRQNVERWEFGTVEAFNEETSEHSLRFMDDQIDWVFVEKFPIEKYIGSHRNEEQMMEQDRNDDSTTKARALFEIGNDAKGFHPSSLEKHFVRRHERVDSILELSGPSLGSETIELFIKEKQEAHHTKKSREIPQMSPSCTEKREAFEMPTVTQRLWTPEEDKKLQEIMIESNDNNQQLKWPMIAKQIPGRSGKQCRERYLNYLKPNLKLSKWSAVEDALIFRLHRREGSKWSMMSSTLRGRSDNSIKNRYHNLKRRLEKRMQAISTSTEMEELSRKLSKCRMLKAGEEVEPFAMKYLAAQILFGKRSIVERGEKDFGPFGPCIGEGTCTRCGMMVPSAQTGRLVCVRTGWCEACTTLSPCVNGDILRLVHSNTIPRTPDASSR